MKIDKKENIRCNIDTCINQSGYIYLIESSVYPGLIKVGRANSFKSRFKNYNDNAPFESFECLMLTDLMRDSYSKETELLSKIYKHGISPEYNSLEWFSKKHFDVIYLLIKELENL